MILYVLPTNCLFLNGNNRLIVRSGTKAMLKLNIPKPSQHESLSNQGVIINKYLKTFLQKKLLCKIISECDHCEAIFD